MTLTSHVTHDNLGKDLPPLSLDIFEKYSIQLPNDNAVVPTSMNMQVMSPFHQ